MMHKSITSPSDLMFKARNCSIITKNTIAKAKIWSEIPVLEYMF
jgi:hypothetical protein